MLLHETSGLQEGGDELPLFRQVLDGLGKLWGQSGGIYQRIRDLGGDFGVHFTVHVETGEFASVVKNGRRGYDLPQRALERIKKPFDLSTALKRTQLLYMPGRQGVCFACKLIRLQTNAAKSP